MDEKTPVFSSDLQYLGRINALITFGMECIILKEHPELYSIIENLFYQIEPRLSTKEIETFETKFKTARDNLKIMKECYRDLNILCHSKKLILRDKSDGSEATEL